MRLGWVVYLSIMLLLCPGCTTWKAIPPPGSGAPDHGSLPARVRVELWSREAFIMYGPTIARDSLFGIREVRPEVQSAMFFNESSRESCAIAMTRVRSIEERKPDPAATGLLLIPVAVIVGLAVWFLVAVSSEGY